VAFDAFGFQADAFQFGDVVVFTEIPVRTAILRAVVTALEAAQMTVRGRPVTIARARTAAVDPTETPFLAVLGRDMAAEPSDNMQTVYTVRLTLAGWLAADTEEDAEDDASELHARVIRALIRPDPDDNPVSLMLADGRTEIWLEEIGMRGDPASIADSEMPMADCVIEMQAQPRLPLGNLFLTVA